jgi:hypothetical protein
VRNTRQSRSVDRFCELYLYDNRPLEGLVSGCPFGVDVRRCKLVIEVPAQEQLNLSLLTRRIDF